MLEFSKRFGICLGIAAAFCLGACDDDSGSDKGKTNSGGDASTAECTSNDDCKDVEGKPVCDQDKKECVEEKKDDSGNEDGGGDGSEDGNGDGSEDGSGDGSEDGSGGGSGNEDKPKECSDGQKLCGDTCRDTTKENDHCGDCDNACTDGKQCVNSVCEFICEGSTPDKCDDGCTNFSNNDNHCGNCETQCTNGKTCIEGHCTKTCENGQKACGANEDCIDILSDNANCGECGNTCKAEKNESCQGGICQAKCPNNNETMCANNTCLNLDSDENCGTCETNVKCDTSKDLHCSASRECATACAKDDGSLEFVNLNTDKNHCGGCTGTEHVCGETQKCDNGSCVEDCTNGKIALGETCIDPKTDVEHCGYDGRSDETNINCQTLTGVATATCVDGVCKITCDDTHDDCDTNPANGCEADLTTPATCGSCKNTCSDDNADASKTKCILNQEDMTKSTCEFTCKDNMKSCDGSCKNILSDKDNCGWCGHSCTGNATCQQGFCTIDKSQCGADGYVSVTIDDQEIKAYCIKTENQFRNMRDAINRGKRYAGQDNSSNDSLGDSNTNNAYIIVDDLVFGNDTSNWKGVGTESYPFVGYFLGNGKKISGVFNTTNSYSGLFGTISKSYIEGFNIDISISNTSNVYGVAPFISKASDSFILNSKIHGSASGYRDVSLTVGYSSNNVFRNISVSGKLEPRHHDCAGIIARAFDKLTMENCDADIEMIPSDDGTPNGTYGGLIGYYPGSGSIKNSFATGSIKTGKKNSRSAIGGLVGYIDGSGEIFNSHASVDIIDQVPLTGISYYAHGGLVGRHNGLGTKIENSYASGKIVCKSDTCGGLIGETLRGINVINSYATGEVSGASRVGGLIGFSTKSEKITGCHATGNVSGTGKSIGGLVGEAGGADSNTLTTIKDSYATGNVTGSKDSVYAGGLVGYAYRTRLNNVFATGSVKAGSETGGLVGSLYGDNVLENCIATGNVTNISQGTSVGQFIGTITGSLRTGYGTNEIANCVGLGDITGGDSMGGIAGRFGSSTETIRNSYSLGKINTNSTNHVGSLVGELYETTSVWAYHHVKNSYYWDDLKLKPVGYGTPGEFTVYPFILNDKKEVVLKDNPNRQLADSLGDDWVSVSCELKSGPKGQATIAVPKSISSDHIDQLICK